MVEHLGNYAIFFVAIFLTSLHCVGMCGPFVLAISGTDDRRSAVRHLAYHAGKTTSYMALGVLASLAGAAVGRWLSMAVVQWAQDMLSWVAGAVIVLVALQMLGVFRLAMPGLDRLLAGAGWIKAFRSLDPSRSAAAAMAAGLVNGFMPCPLVMGSAAAAMAAGSILAGMGYMLTLSLATTPALVAVAAGGAWIRPMLRSAGVRLAGAALMVLAGIAVLRPMPWLHAMMDHPSPPGTATQPSCCHHD